MHTKQNGRIRKIKVKRQKEGRERTKKINKHSWMNMLCKLGASLYDTDYKKNHYKPETNEKNTKILVTSVY